MHTSTLGPSCCIPITNGLSIHRAAGRANISEKLSQNLYIYWPRVCVCVCLDILGPLRKLIGASELTQGCWEMATLNASGLIVVYRFSEKAQAKGPRGSPNKSLTFVQTVSLFNSPSSPSWKTAKSILLYNYLHFLVFIRSDLKFVLICK